MRTFSFRQYWNTFKWMMFSNHRELLTLFGGITLGTFVFEEFIVSPMFRRNGGDVVTLNLVMIFSFYLFFGNLWVMYGASRTFGDIKSRHSAITMLMHPATNLEKFAARITYYSVLWTLLAVVGATLGDVLRYGFNIIVGWNADTPILGTSGSTLMRFMYEDELTAKLIVEVTYLVFSVSLWVHSVYVLGSAFFRRNRFLLSTITLCIVQTFLAAFLPSSVVDVALNSTFSGFEALPALMFAAFHYWLAYILFTRMQVINNKWINL